MQHIHEHLLCDGLEPRQGLLLAAQELSAVDHTAVAPRSLPDSTHTHTHAHARTRTRTHTHTYTYVCMSYFTRKKVLLRISACAPFPRRAAADD